MEAWISNYTVIKTPKTYDGMSQNKLSLTCSLLLFPKTVCHIAGFLYVEFITVNMLYWHYKILFISKLSISSLACSVSHLEAGANSELSQDERQGKPCANSQSKMK